MSQSMIERIDRFKKAADQLQGAKVYYREEWDVYYFDLMGKMFGLMTPEAKEDAMITLKGGPEKNDLLREQYSDVIPGYHTNKVHWNSIKLETDQLTDDEIEHLIVESYHLVYKNVPKKNRDHI
ncbi:MAG: MmcQ/YjbR family DNA-binding protein [Alkalibacterium sp.]|nr:MmcQ/YjbR family DNA-binding protein [Alkalibacterium sp.]